MSGEIVMPEGLERIVVVATTGKPGIPLEVEKDFQEMKEEGTGKVIFRGVEIHGRPSKYLVAKENPKA